MLRHASIYRVTRSCKINQRSSVCQQKATMKKNICLPSKEKSAFSQLQRIENKLYHQTWSRAKLQTARRKLWCEKSFGEFWVPGKLLRLGGCFSAAGMGRGPEMVEGSLYRKKKVYFPQLSVAVHRISHCPRSPALLERARAKDAAPTPSSCSKGKAACALPQSFVFFFFSYQ